MLEVVTEPVVVKTETKPTTQNTSFMVAPEGEEAAHRIAKSLHHRKLRSA